MTQRSRIALLGITALGLLLRLGYLAHATSLPRYVLDDPDHYELKGRALAGDGEGWKWSYDVVSHNSYDHRTYMLPPGYPVFLSWFALFPGYPRSAQVAQALLSAATVLLLFLLGRRLHSERAGLVAAAVYALWVPNIIAVWSTMQESIYVPLVVMSFVLLTRARDGGGALAHGLAGLVLGLATLTRSMPLYFLPLAMALMVLLPSESRRRSALASLWLMAGFLLATLPYSVALSSYLGRPTFVENHGSIFVVERYGGLTGDEPATLTQTAGILIGAFVDSPADAVGDWWETLRSMFHVHGGRLLQIYLESATTTGASVAKLLTHVFSDASFALSLVLAPLGAVLARRRDHAAYLVLWVAVVSGLTALSGFGGPRLRAPLEPHLIALASVVAAGAWRTAAPGLVAGAGAVSLVLGAMVLPQVPASLRARADYGVHWPLRPPPKRARSPRAPRRATRDRVARSSSAGRRRTAPRPGSTPGARGNR